MQPNPQPLPWDSKWLGYPVARLVVPAQHALASLAPTVAHCRATGVRLLYLVIAPEDNLTEAAAQAAGAWLADVKRTYRLELTTFPGPVLPSGEVLVLPTQALTADLEQLAWQSGAFSRFRRDARIGSPAFEALYSRWLHQSLVEGKVWAASVDGKAMGMLAVAFRPQYVNIDLVAVSPAARRRGVGQLLLQAAAHEAQRLGHPALQVVTQGANRAACEFYERFGFRLLHTEQVYHLWL